MSHTRVDRSTLVDNTFPPWWTTGGSHFHPGGQQPRPPWWTHIDIYSYQPGHLSVFREREITDQTTSAVRAGCAAVRLTVVPEMASVFLKAESRSWLILFTFTYEATYE
jgi:hypothetical protein